MTIQVNDKLRDTKYYNFQNVLVKLYNKSSKNKKSCFKKLYDIIISEENILLAISYLKSTYGSKFPGSDRKTINDYLKMNVDDLVKLIRNKLKVYTPKKFRKVTTINKVGVYKTTYVPCMIDRIIQMMFHIVLEPICEGKFYQHSYGYRPNRTVENALANFNQRINLGKLYQIVDINIKSFYNNIDHGKLLKQIWTLGIQDKKVISIISKILKSNVFEVGVPAKKGIL